MKYLVELNDKTPSGKELMTVVRKKLNDEGVRLIKPRKLSPRDMVQGIGRKLTDEELRKHLTRPMKKPVDFDRSMEKIIKALSKTA